MKKITSHKGFTLIELLVVVAIIGLLAATILASLGQARGKAKLARAKSEISSMRAAAELTVNGSGVSYPATLFTDKDSGMDNLVKSVENSYSTKTTKNVAKTGVSWAFSLVDGDINFCADSTGFAGELVAGKDVSSDAELCN